jgi:hypothetical protein
MTGRDRRLVLVRNHGAQVFGASANVEGPMPYFAKKTLMSPQKGPQRRYPHLHQGLGSLKTFGAKSPLGRINYAVADAVVSAIRIEDLPLLDNRLEQSRLRLVIQRSALRSRMRGAANKEGGSNREGSLVPSNLENRAVGHLLAHEWLHGYYADLRVDPCLAECLAPRRRRHLERQAAPQQVPANRPVAVHLPINIVYVLTTTAPRRFGVRPPAQRQSLHRPRALATPLRAPGALCTNLDRSGKRAERHG